MKKYHLLALLSCATQLAWAGPIDQVALHSVDKAIQHKNFQATFTYYMQPDQEGASGEELTGSITVQSDQYRLVMGGQETVSDGTTAWNYLADANEVQINDYDPEQGVSTPWLLLTNYRRDYKFHDCQGAQKIGNKCYDIVTLIAKEADNDLRQIAITIEWGTHHIKRLEALDSNRQRHIFSITKFETELALDDAFFKFIPENYVDIEVIDMRE